MKYAFFAVGLAGLAAATDPCQNNCGRAVAGAGRNPPLDTRSSLCSAFVSTTTTVTGPPTTVTGPIIYNRNVHDERAPELTAAGLSAAGASAAATAAAVTGEKPAYASACPNADAYWTACQCINGVKATVVTVSVAGPTETVAGPTCTQGLEYAIYGPLEGTPQRRNLVEAVALGHQHIDLALQFSGVEPDVTGVTPSIGEIVQFTDDYTVPVSLYGKTGRPGSEMGLSLVAHRGHLLPAVAGLYTLWLETSDNALYAWVGDVAVSGWTLANPSVSRFWPPNPAETYTYSFEVLEADIGKPIPFRVLWMNYGGPGALNARLVDPQGNVILSPTTQKSPLLLTGCTGINLVPGWVPWAEEI